jgi:hypothetical protein
MLLICSTAGDFTRVYSMFPSAEPGDSLIDTIVSKPRSRVWRIHMAIPQANRSNPEEPKC